MAVRRASINDQPIREEDRLFRWPNGPRPADQLGLSELGSKSREMERNYGIVLCKTGLHAHCPRRTGKRGSAEGYAKFLSDERQGELTMAEAAFLTERDGFYMSTVSKRAGPMCSSAVVRRALSSCWMRKPSGSPIWWATVST